jgi:aminopeptidase C
VCAPPKKKILDPGACEKTEVQIKNGPQSLELSKIRGENKKNFEKCWLFIINNCFPNRLVETSGDCEWTDNITLSTNFLYIYKMYHLLNFWKMSIWPNIVINHASGL